MLRSLSQNGSTLPTVLFLSLVVMILTTFHLPADSPAERANLFCSLFSGNHIPLWGSRALIYGSITLIALLLSRLNYTYTLIRTRTTLPFFFAVLLFTLLPDFSLRINTGMIAAPAFTALLFILFSCYQQIDKQSQAFAIGLLTLAISFVIPLFYLYLPLFFIAYYRLHIYTLKTFLAWIIGIFTSLFLAFAYDFVFDKTLCWKLYAEMPASICWIDFNTVQTTLIAFLFLSISTLICTIQHQLSQYHDKIQTRVYNRIIIQFSFFSLLLCIFYFDCAVPFLSVSTTCVVLLFARYFTSARSRFAHTVFYLILLSLIAFYTWSLLPI